MAKLQAMDALEPSAGSPGTGIVSLDYGGAGYALRHPAFGGQALAVDGSADWSAVLEAASASVVSSGGGIVAGPGIYGFDEDAVCDAPFTPQSGCILQPANGVTVTINGPVSAGLYQWIDLSLGGSVLIGGPCGDVFPQWFGAGLGAGDDTAAMQAAIGAASGGRTLRLPKARYPVSGLTLASDLAIRGDGYESELFLVGGLPNARPLVYANECERLTLYNLRVNGNRDGIAGGVLRNVGQPWEGVSLAECVDVDIDRVWVENADNEGLDIDGGDDIDIGLIFVSNCGGAGIHPSHGTGDLVNYGVRIRKLVSSGNGLTYQRGAIYSLDGEFVTIESVRSYGDYSAVQIGGDRECKANIGRVEAIDSVSHSMRIYQGARSVDLDWLYSENAGGSGLWVDGAGDDRKSRYSRVKVVGNQSGPAIRIAGSNWTLLDPEVTDPNTHAIATVSGGTGRIVRPVLRGSAGANSGMLIAASGTKVLDPDVSGFQYGLNATSVTDIECIGGTLTGCEVGYNMTGAEVSARHRIVGTDVTGNSAQNLRRVGSDHRVLGVIGAPAVGMPDIQDGWFLLAVPANVTAGVLLERFTSAYPAEWIADRDCTITQIFVMGSEPRTQGSLTIQLELNSAVVTGFSAQLTENVTQVHRSEVSISVTQGDRVQPRYQTTTDFLPDGDMNIVAGFVVE